MGRGSNALGPGLDGAEIDGVWAALQDAVLTAFVHPHYGLPNDVYGRARTNTAACRHWLGVNSSFLPALSRCDFERRRPLEISITVARILLAGVFIRHAKLQLLVAPSVGTLQFLAGRLESCIAHKYK